MKRRQQIIVWIWIAAVVGAGLFPPWADRGLPAGYHPLFAPPHSRMHIDQSRLMLEWLLMSILAAGSVFAWPERARGRSLNPVPEMPPDMHRWMDISGQKFNWDATRGKWAMEGKPDLTWDVPGYVPQYPETLASKPATHRDALVKLAIVLTVLITLLIGFLWAARTDRGGSGRAARTPQGMY